MSTIWEVNESETESLTSSNMESGDESIEDYYSKNIGEDDWMSLSGSWQSEEDGSMSPATSLHSLTQQEGLRLLHLRKHVDMLRQNVDSCNLEVNKLRDDLAACQQKQLNIVAELMSLDDEDTPTTGLDLMLGDTHGDSRSGELSTLHGRTAGLGLLQGKRNKLKAEMYEEKEEEENIKAALTAMENKVLEAKMAAKEYEGLEEELTKGEAAMKRTKDRKLIQRLEAEARLVATARRQNWTMQLRKSSSEEMIKNDTELDRHRQAAMQRVLARQRETQRKAKEEHQQHVERRMNAILSLRKNITASEDIIQAQHMLHKEQQQRKEEEQKRQILEEGGDLVVETVRRQRMEQLQKKMDDFQKKQEKRKMEIVAKLLKEEESIKQRDTPQPKVFGHDERKKRRRRKKRREKEIGAESRRRSGSAPSDSSRRMTGVGKQNGGEEFLDGSVHAADDQLVPEETQDSSVIMVPEIKGLWEEGTVAPGQAGNPPAVWRPKSHSGRGKGGDNSATSKKRIFSTTEMRMMQNTLEKLRKSIVRKQVAAGREFKGVAFTSKPRVVLFQDFEVGQTYSRNVKLTNVSYTVNHCRLVGMSPSLVDMVSVNFDPPGSMSAGMTCHMLVTFQPQLEEDLDGDIMLLSETGPFNIPVRCHTKKCQVKLDHTHLDFGKVCVGEVVRRKITIYNTGALPTNYMVSRSHVGNEPSVVVESEELEASETGGRKLADKSDLSLKSDFGVYGRSAEEMVMSGANDEYTKSKSAANMEVLLTGTTEGQGKMKSEQENQDDESGEGRISGDSGDGRTTRDGRITGDGRISGDGQITGGGRSSTRDGRASAEYRTSSAEGRASKEGRTTGEGQISVELAGVETTESLVQQRSVPTSSSGSTYGGTQVATPTILQEGSNLGTLEGFSSKTLQFVFSPISPKQDSTEYFIIFSHHTVGTLKVSLAGEGVDLPVYLEEEEVDMKICLVDRLYQCAVVVHNRAVTARQVTFKIPPELQPHLEVLPGYSLVQGNDSLSVQLKFCPGQSLLQNGLARDKFVGPDRRWKIAVRVEVGGQSQAVILTVLADVSPSALVLLPATIDFGSCTTQETVTTPLSLTNTSALMQSFGFVHLPSCVDVQPGDGFGSILPGETVHLDLLFSPDKSKDYEFEVTCKSLLNQTCKVQCKGRGVLSPMILSANRLIFPPTRLGSTSRTTFTLTNSRLSRLSSAMIRGTAPAQGTRGFHFSLPPDSPLSLSPHVGMLDLGQSVTIEASFSPQVTNNMVECMHLKMNASKREEASKADEMKKETTPTSAGRISTDAAKKGAARQAKPSSRIGTKSRDHDGGSGKTNIGSNESGKKKGGTVDVPVMSGRMMSMAIGSGASVRRRPSPNRSKEKMARPPTPGSGSWWEAHHSVLTSYKDQDLAFTIPCFISDTIPSSQTNDRLEGLKHRPEYTLYVEVAGRTVKPELVLSKGQTPAIDFGRVVTGEIGKKQVTVENTSEDTLHVRSSVLDPLGPFSLRNALRKLPPHTTHTLHLHFTPQGGTKTYDTLMLYYGESKSCLELNLIGMGVPLDVTIASQIPSAEGTDGDIAEEKLTCLDLGHVMAGDTVSKTFNLCNHTPLPVHFTFSLASQLTENRHAKKLRGMCSSGRAAFTCVPSEGTVEGELVKEVKIMFDPDRQSAFYADKLLTCFNGKPSSTVDLIGQAWSNTMYLLLSDVEDGICPSSDYLKAYTSQRDTTESLLSPLHSSSPGPLPQTLVITLSYSTTNLHVTKSTSTQNQPENHLNKTTSDLVDQNREQSHDKDRQLSRNKSEPPQTGTSGLSHQRLSKTLSSDELLGKSEEELVGSCRRELVIGCIKSALVKKQSGEFVIEPLNTTTYPMGKCFTIDPLKANVEGGGTRTVTISFTPPKNVISCVEANTTLTLKGESSQTYHLCLRAVVAE